MSNQRIADALESLDRLWSGIQEQNVTFRQSIATLKTANEKLERKNHLLALENKRLKKAAKA